MIKKEISYKKGIIYYKGINTHLTNDILFDILYQTSLNTKEIVERYYNESIQINRNEKINSILNDQTQNN